MPFINSACLGKVASEPNLKQTKNGKPMCYFSVSNTEGWGDHKKKMYLKCIAFGNTANLIQRSYKKGDMILFSYSYDDNPWQKNEKGYDIPNPQFIVQQIHFLPKANSSDDSDVPVTMQMSGVNGSDDDFTLLDESTEDLPF